MVRREGLDFNHLIKSGDGRRAARRSALARHGVPDRVFAGRRKLFRGVGMRFFPGLVTDAAHGGELGTVNAAQAAQQEMQAQDDARVPGQAVVALFREEARRFFAVNHWQLDR